MTTPEENRLDFIDNIRWVMIVLVVSMHAAVTYSHMGSWYFMEDPKPTDLGTRAFFGYYQMGLQAFFMGLLFLVAGYFVPEAYDRKGAGRFLRDRFIRLGIPSLLYMLIIHPVIVYWLLHDHYKITASFAAAYLKYLRDLRFIGSSGPMWFAVALFGFCVVYAGVRRARAGSQQAVTEAPLPTHGQLALLILVIALCTFLVRVVQPMGTSILNMQLCFFSQYVLLFVVGILARRRNWLLRIPYGFGMRWFWLSLVGGTLIWAVAIGAILATRTEQCISGGFCWQSGVVCLWESFFCLGLCLGLIVLFRERLYRQGGFAKWMSDNCFAVYMFHAPVLIAVTLWMRGLVAPKPVKFLVATLLGTAATYLVSSLVFRRIPLLKRVL
jgi:glucans biosynthesis protein C